MEIQARVSKYLRENIEINPFMIIQISHMFLTISSTVTPQHMMFSSVPASSSFLPLHHGYDWLEWEGMAFILQGDEYLEGNCKAGL